MDERRNNPVEILKRDLSRAYRQLRPAIDGSVDLKPLVDLYYALTSEVVYPTRPPNWAFMY